MGFKSAVKGFIRETRQKQIVPIAHPVGAAELLEGKVAFIAGGNGEGLLMKHGEIIKKVPQENLLAALKYELDHWEEE